MKTGNSTPTPAAALREPDAARYLGLSRPYLKRARRLGTGPIFVRIDRAIRYRIADLDAFLEAHRVVRVA